MHEQYINIGLNEDKLIEECSEVIKAICKIKRFGIDEYHPVTKVTNREKIKEELEDLKLAIKNYEGEIK